jgi:hypothetical protein
MSTSLDLGCGGKPKNFFNADITYGIDVRDDLESNIIKADLVIEKIPFNNNTFYFFTTRDFFEHIPRLIYATERRLHFVELMNEVWKVLKVWGKFLSQISCFPHPAALGDPTHVNFLTEQTFPFFLTTQINVRPYTGLWASFKLNSKP